MSFYREEELERSMKFPGSLCLYYGIQHETIVMSSILILRNVYISSVCHSMTRHERSVLTLISL